MTPKPKASHFARMEALVSLAAENAKPAESRKGNEVVTENVISIDATKCRMNNLHRRLKTSIDSELLDELVEQFKTVGQLLPARGWRLSEPDADGTEVVLIFGARRRAAAERANLPLKVEIVPEPTLQALIRQMHSENSSRQDYLPLEQGLEFKAFLDAGDVRTKEELAEVLGVNRVRVVRCIMIAELPPDVLSIFDDPSDLKLVQAVSLASKIESGASVKARVLEAANRWKIAGRTGNPMSALLAAAEGEKPPKKREQDLLNDKRAKLGRITTDPKGGLTLQLRKSAPPGLVEKIKALVQEHFPKVEI